MICNRYRQYSCITSNANIITYVGGFPLVRITRRASLRKQIIYKHYAMPNKTIIAYNNFFTDKAMRLHATSIANDNPLLNFYKRPHKAIISNAASIKITGRYAGNLVAKLHIPNLGLPKGWVHKV